MSAPPFDLCYTAEARQVIKDLGRPADAAKLRKVKKALRLLHEVGPAHPGLSSHKYHSITGPGGEDVWESYVENRTPGTWHIWWIHGPGSDSTTVVTTVPHP